MTRLLRSALALASLAVAAGAEAADFVPLKDAVPHITTTGSASAEVVPDLADLRLGVTNERPTANEAAAATARAASDVVADVKAEGIDPKDIVTSFDISAQYDDKIDEHGRVTGRTFRAYQAHESIKVRVRDVAKAGALARGLIDKGANAVEGVTYLYSREKEKRRDLDATAMRDALLSAKIYTDAVGLKLGRVLQIGEDPAAEDGVADLPLRRAPPVYSVAIPTEPGVQKMTERVTVIFEIEGKAQ